MDLRPLLWAIPIAVAGGLLFRSASRYKSEEEADKKPVSNDSPKRSVKEIHDDQFSSKRRHLIRVGNWGSANMAGGATLYAGSGDESLSAFGLQSGLWGFINTGIAVGGLTEKNESSDDPSKVQRSERNYSDILLLNLGLNAGYIGVGTTMIIAAQQGVCKSDQWKGHGSAIILQGIGLFILDALSWKASRERMRKLLNRNDEA